MFNFEKLERKFNLSLKIIEKPLERPLEWLISNKLQIKHIGMSKNDVIMASVSKKIFSAKKFSKELSLAEEDFLIVESLSHVLRKIKLVSVIYLRKIFDNRNGVDFYQMLVDVYKEFFFTLMVEQMMRLYEKDSADSLRIVYYKGENGE